MMSINAAQVAIEEREYLYAMESGCCQVSHYPQLAVAPNE